VRTALAAVLFLALAAPAAAQQDQFTPVVGSGSFNAAPILAPGTYRDTVLPEEYLYYAVRLQAGQRLHVVAKPEIDKQTFTDLGLAYTKLNVAGPDREQLFDITGTQSFTDDVDPPADFTTPAATTIAEQNGQGAHEAWKGPGVYFLSVYPIYVGSHEVPKAEIPFTFQLSVEGTAQAEPKATPVATKTPKPAPTPTPTPAEASGGASPALAAGFGVGGLLLGALGGLALRRRGPGTGAG
jgi:Ca-activated chloride channel family protein